jgi:dephospho-CoA kinase
MKLIGLTGGIACGKSTVSSMFKELGAVVIDADKVARHVVEPGQKALDLIAAQFGGSILNSDGTLNRKALGRVVFKDMDRLKALNSIIHPEIKRVIIEEVDQIKKSNQSNVVIIDAPVLLESGMDEMVDEVWLVYVDPEIQVERLINRDNISLSEACIRIKSQMPVEDKIKKSDRIIDNSKGLEYTMQQVREIWQEIIMKP